MAEIKLNLGVEQGIRIKAFVDAIEAKAQICEAQAKGFRIAAETFKAMFIEYIAQVNGSSVQEAELPKQSVNGKEAAEKRQ